MTAATIPSVKEQVRKSATAKVSAGPQRETIEARRLTILGRVGRSTFALDPEGRELKLKGPVEGYRVEEAPADAIVVTKVVRGSDGRPRPETYLASAVETGTFEKLSKRKAYTPRSRPPTPIDRFAELRGDTPRQVVHLGKDDDSDRTILKGALSSYPTLLFTDGRAGFRSIAGEIAYLERSGIALALSADGAYLLVTSAKGLTGERRTMLDGRASLYRAHLRGEPITCAWPHDEGAAAPAVTYAVGGAPVCGPHLSGED